MLSSRFGIGIIGNEGLLVDCCSKKKGFNDALLTTIVQLSVNICVIVGDNEYGK